MLQQTDAEGGACQQLQVQKMWIRSIPSREEPHCILYLLQAILQALIRTWPFGLMSVRALKELVAREHHSRNLFLFLIFLPHQTRRDIP